MLHAILGACLVLTIAFGLATLHIIAILMIVFVFLISDKTVKLCYLMMWLPFITLLTVSGVPFSAYNFMMLAFLLHSFLAGDRFRIPSLLWAIALIAYELMNLSNMGIPNFIAWASEILFLVVIFNSKKLTMSYITQILSAFLFGFFVSSNLGMLIRILFPGAAFYFKTTSAINGQFSLSILRFTGLMYDPNYFAQSCLMALACAIILFKRGGYPPLNRFYIGMMGLMAIVYGFYSYSKMFIAVVLIIGFIAVMEYLYSNKDNAIKSIVIGCLGAIAIIILFLMPVTQAYLSNLSHRINMGDLTTGRTDITKMFLEKFSQVPQLLLFGRGISTAAAYFGFELHNIYLEAIFSYGIIGLLIYSGFCLYHFNINIAKIRIVDVYYFFPLLVLVFTGLSLHGLWADWHYMYLMIVFFGLKHAEMTYEKKEEAADET